MTVVEAQAKECSYVLVQRTPLYGTRNGAQRNLPARAVQKVAARDAGLDLGLFSRSGVNAPERVRSFHKKLVYDYREREPVMMDVPVHIGEA